MKQGGDTGLLGIYLNDHLAALIAGRELVKRIHAAAANEDDRAFLTDLASHLEAGERELERLLRHIGVRRSHLKSWLAWTGEKLGRLKLNGRIKDRSPLSELVELEGLATLFEYEYALWRALHETAPQHAHPADDFLVRAQQARERRDLCERRTQAAANRSLAAR